MPYPDEKPCVASKAYSNNCLQEIHGHLWADTPEQKTVSGGPDRSHVDQACVYCYAVRCITYSNPRGPWKAPK
jgi:hypothetical protein